jgi:hypothetical protein
MKKYGILLIVVFLAFGCAMNRTNVPDNGYEEWLSTCKDYKDVAKWMSQNLVYDDKKFEYYWNHTIPLFLQGKIGTEKLILTQSPEETFKLKLGVCNDGAVFAKHSLNRINPDYKAEIIYIGIKGKFAHYQCGFFVDGKLYVIDYTSGLKEKSFQVEGTHGPFKDLKEYENVFCRMHPLAKPRLDKIHFGWSEFTNPENRKW